MTSHDDIEGHILVIGAAGTDIVGRSSASVEPGTSNPGILRISTGGVARNIAENLSRLGASCMLISAVGDDPEGQHILEQLRHVGVNTENMLVLPHGRTGAYLAVLGESGGLYVGLDDMRAVNDITPEHLGECSRAFEDAAAVVLDANLSLESLEAVFGLARQYAVPVAADPTSRSLARRLKPHLKQLWILSPNETEAEVLCPLTVPHEDEARAIEAARHLVSQGVDIAMITRAEFGVGYATSEGSGHIPALKTEIADPTGAGDALLATTVFALLHQIPVDEAVRLGVTAAALTLRTPGSVVPDLSLELLYDQLL